MNTTTTNNKEQQKMEKTTLMNAINNSKFAKNAFDNDHAFDITVNGIIYEIGPERWTYDNGIRVYNKSTGEISYL